MTVIAMLSGAINNNIAVICIALMIIVNLGYGGGFSNLPTLLSDVYGMGKISSIHGIALSAWAFAGLTGNQIAGVIYNATGSYQNILYFTLAMYVVAILVDFLLIRGDKNTVETEQVASEEIHA
jgi:OFA family oxalate/formate antiporter-like MFS transporter